MPSADTPDLHNCLLTYQPAQLTTYPATYPPTYLRQFSPKLTPHSPGSPFVSLGVDILSTNLPVCYLSTHKSTCSYLPRTFLPAWLPSHQPACFVPACIPTSVPACRQVCPCQARGAAHLPRVDLRRRGAAVSSDTRRSPLRLRANTGNWRTWTQKLLSFDELASSSKCALSVVACSFPYHLCLTSIAYESRCTASIGHRNFLTSSKRDANAFRCWWISEVRLILWTFSSPYVTDRVLGQVPNEA
eukprot:6172520-Pleurochrysis_carterae.AAC.1